MKKRCNQLKKWVFLPSLLFLLFSCNKHPENSPVIEKEFNLAGFNKIYAGERFNLVITKSNDFHIKIKGPAGDVNDITMSVTNNILDIQYTPDEGLRSKVDLVITLPMLVQLNLSGASNATVNGFHNVTHVIRAVLSGASTCILNGTGINTQIDISGASGLYVIGSTKSLYGTISGAGKLNAYDLTATEVDISASGRSEARVKTIQSLFAEASGGSCILYKGNPIIKNIQTSGGGRVIPKQEISL
ncbi:MAG: head GIN domain-containing protein [Bacteroidota bacterium]|nr:head GIN domain-containing protein [Bacteroidota bacterium]